MDYNNRIDKLIDKYNNINYVYCFKDNKEKIINNYNNNITISDRIQKITDLVYNQDWSKLHIINKKIKIEEFMDNLIKNNNNSNLIDIKKEIIIKLKDKKITKKDIQYDKVNGKILDILCLQKKNNIFILS
jgi:hypothetical protein